MISEYRRFLRDRGGKDALVAALAASGHALEAALLGEWSGGRLRTHTDSGRRAWVGSTLPPEASAGDLWLDTVELMPMLLVPWPDLPRPLGWIALRPVERWQFGAGDEPAPVTGVSHRAAAAYAHRLGKSLATRTGWRIAAEEINVTPLWGAARREWDGAVFDEVHSVFGPDTLDVDPHEAPDDPPGTPEGQRLFFHDTDTPADVGFRTFVRHDIGLQPGGATRDAEPVDPVPLTDAFTVFLRERTGREALVAALGGRLEASLLAGPETAPVSRLLRSEAQLYADWFGKEIAGRAARRGEPLWGAVREWAEEAQPGIFSVIDAATVDLDPLAPEPPGRWDESRRRFEEWWAPFGVGFRTHKRA